MRKRLLLATLGILFNYASVYADQACRTIIYHSGNEALVKFFIGGVDIRHFAGEYKRSQSHDNRRLVFDDLCIQKDKVYAMVGDTIYQSKKSYTNNAAAPNDFAYIQYPDDFEPTDSDSQTVMGLLTGNPEF